MMATITSLRLRSLWGFFKLSWLALKITQQAKTEIGFLAMKNTGFGYLHYTATLWQSEEDLKRFSKSGAHAIAMKHSSALATEICTYTFPTKELPDWKEAKQLLGQKGRLLKMK